VSLKMKTGVEEIVWKYHKRLQEAKRLGCVRIELWVSEFEEDLADIEKELLGQTDTGSANR